MIPYFCADPVTFHGDVSFSDLRREGECLRFTASASVVDPDTFETVDFMSPLMLPCHIVRADGTEGAIQYMLDVLWRGAVHVFGPITFQRLAEQIGAFLRSADLPRHVGDRPFLLDMPALGHC